MAILHHKKLVIKEVVGMIKAYAKFPTRRVGNELQNLGGLYFDGLMLRILRRQRLCGWMIFGGLELSFA